MCSVAIICVLFWQKLCWQLWCQTCNSSPRRELHKHPTVLSPHRKRVPSVAAIVHWRTRAFLWTTGCSWCYGYVWITFRTSFIKQRLWVSCSSIFVFFLEAKRQDCRSSAGDVALPGNQGTNCRITSRLQTIRWHIKARRNVHAPLYVSHSNRIRIFHSA
jgi:hypothetical protein